MSDRDTAITRVTDGARFSVWMTDRVREEFKDWPVVKRAALIAIMKNLAEHGPEDLPPTQFKSEQRLTPNRHNKAVMIYAVKEDEKRLYGGFVGNRFICTTFDGAKKKRKADPEKLQRAADYLGLHLGK